MKAERARLARLNRLERVRAIAKQSAAAEAAQAESTLAQLETLAERTRKMAEEYATRVGMLDGAAMRQLNSFAKGLEGISSNTANDAANARRIADFKMQAETVRRLLDELKRDPATFTVSKRVYIAVDANKSRAEERLRSWFGVRYGNADLASRVAIWGSVDACVDQLADIIAAGAGHVLLNPAFDDLEHLELFAGEVTPTWPGL